MRVSVVVHGAVRLLAADMHNRHAGLVNFHIEKLVGRGCVTRRPPVAWYTGQYIDHAEKGEGERDIATRGEGRGGADRQTHRCSGRTLPA
jgi:hypothetical protein